MRFCLIYKVITIVIIIIVSILIIIIVTIYEFLLHLQSYIA